MNFGCQAFTLAPWDSQLLSEGRNPRQGALGASKAGAEVKGRNSPAAGLRGSTVFLTALIGCGNAQAITKAECPKAPLLGGPGEIAEHLLTLGSATT